MWKNFKSLWFQEMTALFVWFPVFFALGILIYFALPTEMALSLALVLSFITGVLWFFARKEPGSYYLMGFIFFLCFGFFIAALKTHSVQAPILKEPLFDYAVQGRVEQVRVLMESQQLLLTDVEIETLPAAETPKYIRMTVPHLDPVFKPGDVIATTGYVFPPRAPVQTGAYNFMRAAYFQQVGASLHPTTDVDLIYRSEHESRLEALRQSIEKRVKELLPAETAGVVIPLIIGEQGTVSKEIYEIYRKTGIMHVLSVSGFHLTLLAGFVFFVIRGLLSLIPFLALRMNTKKVAAFTSICFTFFYLLISGMAVPAIRSFIMILIVLLGVLFDRNTLSVRSVALAAFFILLLWPESLLSASFQLSFMAVLSLVTLYTALMNFVKEHHFRTPGPVRWLALFIIGLFGVNVLASLATAPYTIYHFNQYANYSLLGNFLTTGLFSFCVMPLLLIGVLLMPFGGDALFIKGAGHCLDLIAELCRWVSELPYASLTVRAMPDWSLILISFGFLMIFLMKTKLRWLGVLVCAVSLVGYCFIKTPDILVAEGGRVFAVKDENGKLHLSNLDYPFITDVWLRRNGQDPDTYAPSDLFLKESVRLNGHKISFSSLDCQNAELTFRFGYSIGDCPGREITQNDLWEQKALMIYVHPDRIIIRSVLEEMGKRAWNPDFMLADEFKKSYDKGNLKNGDE